jgi:hypothetical protein
MHLWPRLPFPDVSDEDLLAAIDMMKFDKGETAVKTKK